MIVNYPHYDQVGSLRAITDTMGNVVKRIDYDSFGNIITGTNPAFQVPFGFAGGLHDRDTGLVRFGFRDYDPAIGRWTAKDPIDFAGGDVNLYLYVQSDSVNFTDSIGLDPQIPAEEGGGYWTVNPVTQCHLNPKRNQQENLREGLIIGGALMGLFVGDIFHLVTGPEILGSETIHTDHPHGPWKEGHRHWLEKHTNPNDPTKKRIIRKDGPPPWNWE